ncbi:MAG TPA: NHLP bacteriocin export ABC transporter permease/ATPase subunit, partial [Vicinamibacterales bacterium]
MIQVATLGTRLAQHGALQECGSDRPFLLDGGGCWYVHTGRVDVFRVPLREGAPAGARTHLFRVQEGQLLFGMSGRRDLNAGMLAVGGPGTQLVRVEAGPLRELASDATLAAQLGALLEAWVGLLCGTIADEVPPPDCAELTPGAEPPAGATSIRPNGRVVWVRDEAGSSLLLGRRSLRLPGTDFIPLARGVWLQLAPESRLRVEGTPELLGSGDAWDGLDQLHALVLDCATQIAERAVAAERERLRLKAAADRRILSAAFSHLASTIDGKPADRPDELGGMQPRGVEIALETDPLFLACRRVGAAIGVEMRPAIGDHGRGVPRDPLASIAQASRVRTRQVLLRDGWWREDGGPFLAHLEADRRPVALLPVSGRGYVMFDPMDGTERRVDAALAATIDPRAYSFYRPFAEEGVGLGALLRFGLRGCGRDLATAALVSLAAGLLSLVVPIATGIIFNDVIPSADRSQLAQLAFALVAIAIATALFDITRSVALIRIQGKLESATQSAVWDRLLSLPLPFFRSYTAGELATRAMGIDAIRQLLAGYTVTALISGVVSLLHLALLFHYSGKLARWAALIILIAVVVTAFAVRLQTRYERLVARIHTRLAGAVLQFLTSVSKLRVAGAELQAFSIWSRAFSEQRRVQYRARTVANAVAAFNAALPTIAHLVLYGFALSLLREAGSLRTGDFMAFTTSFGTCLTGILGAFGALQGTLGIIPLYEQARPILTTRPEVDRGKADPGTLTGNIEIQHVRFRYQPDGPLVLRDLTLSIRPGEFVALVGPSGSGKSTVLRLLLGFESPEAGAIYYDGQDLAGLDRQAVRRQIGVVLQNGRLMAGDIFTNIVGSSLATIDDAWEAARMAGLDEDIRAMPMG